MDTALREFRLSLCAEHVDEAASLHDLCAARRRDPLSDWLLPLPFEQRLELHLDALVLGGDAATAVCSDVLAAADDAAACHAAAATWALRDDTERLAGLWALRPDADAKAPSPETRAVDLALAQALSEYLSSPALPRFVEGAAAWAHDGQHAGWTVLARRRVDSRGLLASRLQVQQAAPLALLAAAGDCPDPIDPAAARRWYDSDDAATRRAALRAGLLRADAQALQVLRGDAAAAAPVLAAMVRGRSAVKPLVAALAGPHGADAAVALGVLGDLSAVRPLVASLSDERRAPWCAQALHVITGLAPREQVHVPDPVSDDELFERERVAWRRDGTVPKAAGGLPFGRHVERLSHDGQVWRALLHQSAGSFVAGTRYRFGQACTPQGMVQGLLMPGLGPAFRGPFADELRLRHGIDLAIDMSTPVQTQLRRLRRVAASLAGAPAAQAPGRWWLGGREVDA